MNILYKNAFHRLPATQQNGIMTVTLLTSWNNLQNTLVSPTSNNQRLRSMGDNNRRSKRFCPNAVLCVSFTWEMVKTRVFRLRVIRRSKRAWSTLDTSLLAIPHLRIRFLIKWVIDINLFSLGNNCIDKHNLCKQWAKDNLCERGNETMDSQSVQKVCSKSCSVCFKWAVQQVSSCFYKGTRFRHFISKIRDFQYLKINVPLVLRCS